MGFRNDIVAVAIRALNGGGGGGTSHGIPAGGKTGQTLKKKSDASYDVEWGGGNDDIATEDRPGAVKPDGTSIEVDEDGTIHSKGGNPLTDEQLNALLALL